MSPGRKAGRRPSPIWSSRRDPDVIEQALLLGLDFDEPKAVGVLRRIALDPATPTRRAQPDARRAWSNVTCRSSPPTFRP